MVVLSELAAGDMPDASLVAFSRNFPVSIFSCFQAESTPA